MITSGRLFSIGKLKLGIKLIRSVFLLIVRCCAFDMLITIASCIYSVSSHYLYGR